MEERKKYSVIYADPPWSYNDKLACGNRGSSFKYKTLSAKDIKSLPVQNIAADNCVLFLWITPPLLPVGLEVLKAWGFKYNTLAFNWVKWNKKANSPFWGLGHSTRANAELCLLGKRGKVVRESASVSQVIVDPVAKHSAKPDIVRRRIEDLYGDVPRIELFARSRGAGWDATGLDFDGVDIRDFLA